MAEEKKKKQHVKLVAMTLTKYIPKAEKLRKLPSTAMSFNLNLDGGLLEGRIMEVYGKFKQGKTRFIIDLCENALNTFPETKVYFFDVENVFTLRFIKHFTPEQKERFYIIKSNQPLVIFRAIEKLYQDPNVQRPVVILDSIAAMAVQDQLAPLHDKLDLNFQKLCSRFLGRNLHRIKGWLICVNQTRFNMAKALDPYTTKNEEDVTTPGGDAVKFYSSYRFRVFKRSAVDEKNKFAFKIVCTKNKLGEEFMCFTDVDRQLMLVPWSCTQELLVSAGVLESSNAEAVDNSGWYWFAGTGEEKPKKFRWNDICTVLDEKKDEILNKILTGGI